MSELPAKLEKLGQLYAAIDRTKAEVGLKPVERALQLQSLKNQAVGLRKTLPKPRLVESR